MNKATFRSRHVAWQNALVLSALALSACGGGGSSASDATASTASTASTDTSSTDSATASIVPTESAQAIEATMATTQAVIASSNAGSGLACPGGGVATYSVTGGAADGTLTTGEVYQFSFQGCKGAANAIAVTGEVTLSITSATSTLVAASLVISQLQAALPLSRVTLNGAVLASSGLLYVRGSSGPALSLDSTLAASGVSVSRVTASRTVSYVVNALNLHQLSQFDSTGQITSSQVSGSATLSTSRVAGTFSASLAMQSAITFIGGMPSSGQWTVTLPNSLLKVSAASGSVSVDVDLDKDGNLDFSRTFVAGTWAASVA